MGKTKTPGPAATPAADGAAKLLHDYGCGPVRFTGTDEALYERRLVFDHVLDPKDAGPREQFEALSAAVRDVLAQRWVKTSQQYDRANPKQVYYLSMEFLIGRSLANNVVNLLLSPLAESFEKAKMTRSTPYSRMHSRRRSGPPSSSGSRSASSSSSSVG